MLLHFNEKVAGIIYLFLSGRFLVVRATFESFNFNNYTTTISIFV